MYGERLRQYRKSKSLTLVKFGQMLGISHGSLSELENNINNPSADTLASLVRYTDINIVWLLSGEGDMTVSKPLAHDRLQVNDETPVKYIIPADDPDVSHLLDQAAEVLRSNNKTIKTALAANIKSFHRSMEIERNVDALEMILHPPVPDWSEAKEQ
jgi:transcriptional regulator with XRE-family HTH domain